MTTYSSNPDGTITDDEVEFLRRRSKGVGMAVTAACYVSNDGKAFDGQWSCADDRMIPSLRRAADAIREGGAASVLQLHHGGRMSPARLLGHAPISASNISAERPGADTPRAMTDVEIEATIKAFGAAAKRAIQAGFDGVEIHGANTYLLQQFFSPHSNRRGDMWGGTVENRAAFPIAVLEEVQEIVRRNAYRPFLIGYRLSPEEVEEPGITMEDTLQLVEGLAACRPNWLHISTWDYFAGSIRDTADKRPRAGMIADLVKEKTIIIGAGKVVRPEEVLQVMDDGPELVAMARALVTEPEWVEKVLTGHEEEIRTCLPSTGADDECTIPTPMYKKMLSRPGWFKICPEEPILPNTQLINEALA